LNHLFQNISGTFQCHYPNLSLTQIFPLHNSFLWST